MNAFLLSQPDGVMCAVTVNYFDDSVQQAGHLNGPMAGDKLIIDYSTGGVRAVMVSPEMVKLVARFHRKSRRQ